MLRNLCVGVVVMLLLLAFAVPGRAEKAHSGEQVELKELNKEAEKAEKKDILDPRFDLGIWSIVIFVVLLLVLRAYAWGPILGGLQRREQGILGAIKEAEDARAAAQQLRQQLQQEMDHAQDKVREVLEKARRDAQQLAEQMQADARAAAQADRERSLREVEMAKDQAMQQILTQAADLAALMSTKAIRRQMTPDDHRHLIEEALADLRRAGDERQRRVASLQ